MSMTSRFAVLALAAALAGCASKQPTPPQVAQSETPAPAPESQVPSGRGSDAVASAPTPGLQEALASVAGDRVFFDLDSHTLSGDARAVLERQAAWLSARPDVRTLVAGSCDERGTREYNLALGARRAAAVREFLIARGVGAGRIQTISYGKEMPLDPGADEAAWARNRNAHTQVM